MKKNKKSFQNNSKISPNKTALTFDVSEELADELYIIIRQVINKFEKKWYRKKKY